MVRRTRGQVLSRFWVSEPIAQMVEQLTFNQRVAGSNPAGLTITL
jgi:hypothetical protein